MGDGRTPWVLGTQLHPEVGPLDRAESGSRVLLIEAREFARRKPYHHQKLTLVFAAMRHFRDELRERGYDVMYLQADTFRAGLAEYFERYPEDTLVVMRSPSHRAGERLAELGDAVGGTVAVVENDLFLSTPAAVDAWADDRSGRLRHEDFYRWLRRETGVLMDGDEPVGGQWNYDEDNREFPPDEWESPPRLTFEPDELTRRTSEWVAETFETWGRSEPFEWPVTRRQARRGLRQFVDERLPVFGPYQDAMVRDDPAMAHALLSPAINLGLLHPGEVVDTAVEAHEREDLPLNSVEGFVRQVLGWREFMRHVYRREMPELATANQLGADHELPDAYWSGETDMACLDECVGDVHDRGYAHHIQRLMVLSNFATLWGVEPRQLNAWFHATFVDAYHWVTTPNVIEMGSYGAGVFATKPYVSSANYVRKMSDYCDGCRYDPDATTGEDACPFNALYWDFLARNEDDLRSNHRMGLMYGHVDSKRESDELADIEARVADLREREREGDL